MVFWASRAQKSPQTTWELHDDYVRFSEVRYFADQGTSGDEGGTVV